ncbi:hypothetical protein EVAR_67343_1 [Eumeta japonica]|uniref:Uncharacterized protein n=1 Tax=Eumeta variegata TaxID=151549 RepID=A0A4C2A289_EUMVA|nr:hypothetical protein EVAR_67343_1 [Eumeta japonica]
MPIYHAVNHDSDVIPTFGFSLESGFHSNSGPDLDSGSAPKFRDIGKVKTINKGGPKRNMLQTILTDKLVSVMKLQTVPMRYYDRATCKLSVLAFVSDTLQCNVRVAARCHFSPHARRRERPARAPLPPRRRAL